MKHHIIYVPGLGDQRPAAHPSLLQAWRIFGVRVHYLPLGWADGEDFSPKLKRLLTLIDSLQKPGNSVSLLGVSAGASAVLNAYSERKNLSAVVCVCGKINNPWTIPESKFKQNPAFKQSLALLQQNLPKLNKDMRGEVMSIHPLGDHSVPPADTLIPGAIEVQVPTYGHIVSIAYCLVFKARYICKFVKSV